MFYVDYLYLLIVLPCAIWAIITQTRVSSVFNKYSKVITRAGITGYDSARMVLDANGLYNVNIERVSGHLSDHYDPRANVIRLSDSVYSSSSSAAIGVAAHEAGHAVQHACGYFPVKLRMAIIPVTNFCSKWSMLLILIGVLFLYVSQFAFWIMIAGVAFFATSTLFQLITLPVEFNASARAMQSLRGARIFSEQELDGAKSVLRAAAMTYVAALAVSMATLLRYLLIIMSANNRRRK